MGHIHVAGDCVECGDHDIELFVNFSGATYDVRNLSAEVHEITDQLVLDGSLDAGMKKGLLEFIDHLADQRA